MTELGSAVVSFGWVLIALSGVIVTARGVLKILRFHGLAWEDYLMIISMLLAVVYGVSTTLLYGTNPTEHSAFHSPRFAQYIYICHAVGFLAPLFSRISFCLYMLRVLSTTSATRKRCIYAFIALQLLVNVPMSILVFTQCGDFHNLWGHGMAESAPSCVHHIVIKSAAITASVFNAVTDLFLTILPAMVVWSIKVMTPRARLGLVATLGLSFFATVASAIKAYYVYAMYTFAPSMPEVGHLIIVMCVEINVVIIAASIPVLAPLFLQKSGRSRKGMYKDPVLPTYDISAEGPDVSMQSSSKIIGSSAKSKNISIATTAVDSSVESRSGYMAPQTPWDELPEFVSITLRLSLAFLSLRFLLERWQRLLVYAMLAIFVMDSVASILLVLSWCPHPAQYAAKTLSAQCVGTTSGLNAASILQAVLNAIADWLFATLPVIVIFKATTTNRREKFIVAGIFAFAITGSVATTLRPVVWPALTHGSDSGIRTGMTWVCD
ncbi:hypothetical protein E4T52_14237 [Aureobasidium sp. EXF-3400]|nr:hypothetical protein E4T51_13246 [Aureobasidium sp. EXF-12344]KAI4770751.1 hypothetical protein E4T52_14237 [Aureobasidium sp. EXF-3400]